MNPRRRRDDRPPRRPATLAWLALFCLAVLFGCAGGSGSSGFDVVENAAIDQALDEQRCVDSGGLVICPADTAPGVATPPSAAPTPRFTATPTVEPTATATPTREGPDNTPPSDTPVAIETGTATPPRPAATTTATATITRTFTPTATATPAGMRIDVGLDRTSFVDCLIVSDTCGFSFAFTVQGFPEGNSFLVASRRLAPESPWQISVPVPVGDSSDGSFDVLITVPVTDPGETISVQVAILAQSAPVDSAPTSVDALGESAAEFAFVTPELQARPIP